MSFVPSSSGKSELVGVFDWVKFQKENFIIAALRSMQSIKGNVDEDAPLVRGLQYRFFGKWEESKYGKTFSFTDYVQDTPNSVEGIQKYLEENCKGVGYTKSRLLTNTYGTKAVDVLRDDPDRVVADKILNKEDALDAAQCLRLIAATQKTSIDLMDLFKGRGFPRKLVKKCIAQYGASGPAIIRKNPFQLLIDRMPGCGFKRVDRLYTDLRLDPAAEIRQIYCTWNAIASDTSGNTWHTKEKIESALKSLIGGTKVDTDNAIKAAIKAKLITPHVALGVPGKKLFAEYRKAMEESYLVEEIRRLLGTTEILWPKPPLKECSDHQNTEIAKALSLPIGLLLGYPGSGKSYSTAAIVSHIKETMPQYSVAVCAPTGKAAVRVTQAMAKCGLSIIATTIHRLLGIGKPEDDSEGFAFEFNRGNPLKNRFIIVDEGSMCSVSLLLSLLSALSVGTHVLIVGDPKQLLPVDHGCPLRDMSKFLSSVGTLTEIHRQKNPGMIVKACHSLKDTGKFTASSALKESEGKNLKLIPMKDAEEIKEKVLDLVRDFVGKGADPFSGIQVICSVNKKSPLSRHVLNKSLQSLLNREGKQCLPNPFRVGDKIICLKNSFFRAMHLPTGREPADLKSWIQIPGDGEKGQEHFVANGEIGKVMAIAEKAFIASFPEADRTKIIFAPFVQFVNDDGQDEEPSSFDLGYAVTGHKMQGSECPVVIIPVDDYGGAHFVCSREWWYTSISRASRFCILIGSESVIRKQCSRIALNERKTFLVEKYNGTVPLCLP